jgi:hypothetical protein
MADFRAFWLRFPSQMCVKWVLLLFDISYSFCYNGKRMGDLYLFVTPVWEGNQHMIRFAQWQYQFRLQGEDRKLFNYNIEADSIGEAEERLEEVYPEATLIDVLRVDNPDLYNQGAHACANNKTRDENPYDQGTNAFSLWDAGFSAQLAHEMAVRRADLEDEYGAID